MVTQFALFSLRESIGRLSFKSFRKTELQISSHLLDDALKNQPLTSCKQEQGIIVLMKRIYTFEISVLEGNVLDFPALACTRNVMPHCSTSNFKSSTRQISSLFRQNKHRQFSFSCVDNF
jgi:hypothetical protein